MAQHFLQALASTIAAQQSALQVTPPSVGAMNAVNMPQTGGGGGMGAAGGQGGAAPYVPQGMPPAPAGRRGAPPPRLPQTRQGAEQLRLGREGYSNLGSGYAARTMATKRGNAIEEQEMLAQEAEAQRLADLEAERVRAVASKTHEMAVPVYGEKQARNMADMIALSPEVAGEMSKAVMEGVESMRSEGASNTREDSMIAAKEKERELAYLSYRIPPATARAMSLNEDLAVDAGVELYWKQNDNDKAAVDAKFAEQRAYGTALESVDNTIKQVNKTLGSAEGFGAVGLISSIYGMIPETDAYNTIKQVDTQKAVNAFKELRDMREASKTGGALGNVSNREIELLYGAFTNLEPKTGQIFIDDLADVLQRFERVKYMLRNEERFMEDGVTGDEMYRQSTDYVNRKVARQMGTDLIALERLKGDPESIGEFRKTFGWTPTNYEQE